MKRLERGHDGNDRNDSCDGIEAIDVIEDNVGIVGIEFTDDNGGNAVRSADVSWRVTNLASATSREIDFPNDRSW